jgi:hypothetical protein
MFELLDKPDANGTEVAEFLKKKGADEVEVTKIQGQEGSTDGIKVIVKGKNGKISGGSAPTLGVIGRLGGLGARPDMIGFVSDGDGALTALAVASKLVDMKSKGDLLAGDVIITTHICPDAPIREHKPVPFMDSPIDMKAMNQSEVIPEMDAILSIDTTKGNKIINHKGFAISPTIKEGYILKVSDDLINLAEQVSGEPAAVFAVSQQDITPYGNGLFHINSILQPAVSTSSPVVGVAITTAVPVAGCATGASHFEDVEKAGRYVIEVAKQYGSKLCQFYDEKEYKRIIKLYGKMNKFQKSGLSQ